MKIKSFTIYKFHEKLSKIFRFPIFFLMSLKLCISLPVFELKQCISVEHEAGNDRQEERNDAIFLIKLHIFFLRILYKMDYL